MYTKGYSAFFGNLKVFLNLILTSYGLTFLALPRFCRLEEVAHDFNCSFCNSENNFCANHFSKTSTITRSLKDQWGK